MRGTALYSQLTLLAMQVTQNGNATGTSTMLQTPLMDSRASRADELFIPSEETIPPQSDNSDALRQRGLIRAHGIIPTKLNDRLKAMARAQGRNADQLIGELIQRSASEVDRW